MTLLVIEKRGDGVSYSFLAKEEHLVYVSMIAGAGTDARVDLAKLGHDGQQFFLNHLWCGALADQIGFVCT